MFISKIAVFIYNDRKKESYNLRIRNRGPDTKICSLVNY